MRPPTFEIGEQYAATMDARDPLAHFRDRFHIPVTESGEEGIYLCGHSLGLQPRRARELVLQELDDWARFAVEGHFSARSPWVSYHETLTDATLRHVFGVAEAADHIPSRIPFILPHAACKVCRDERQLSTYRGRRADAGVI